MDPQQSTLVQALLDELSKSSASWYQVIFPFAKMIFYTLVGFQLLWNSITYSLGKRQGDEFISMLFILVVDVGFFYSLMLHPDWILDTINSFRFIGSQSANISTLSPDSIIDTGLGLASAVISSVSYIGLFDFGAALIVTALVIAAILIAFALIAARMVLILAEIFLAVNIGPMLLAFSGLSATKYIATQYIGYVIGAGIQLLVMYLLIGSGLGIATGWTEVIKQHGSKDANALMLVGSTCVLYAVLVWNLPKIIAGLSAGAPQMSSGGFASTAMAVASGLKLGKTFARGAIEAGQSFTNTAKAAAAHYSAGRELGQSKVKAMSSLAMNVSKAAAASGVNSITGRHGRRSAAERISTATVGLRSKTVTSQEKVT